MTKEEFIKRYGIAPKYKTDFGFEINGRKKFALPCGCEDEICNGWAMVDEECVDDHMYLYAPREGGSGKP